MVKKTGYALTVFFLLVFITLASFVFYLYFASGVPLNFAKPYIEKTLQDYNQDYQSKIGHISLVFGSWINPFSFQVDHVELSKNEAETINIQKARFGLSIPDLFTGRVRPSYLVIHELELSTDFILSALQGKNNALPSNETTESNFFMLHSIEKVACKNCVIVQKQDAEKKYIALANMAAYQTDEGVEADIVLDLKNEDSKRKSSIQAKAIYSNQKSDIIVSASWLDILPAQFKSYLPTEYDAPFLDITTSGKMDFIVARDLSPISGKAMIEASHKDSRIQIESSLNKKDQAYEVPIEAVIENITRENFVSLLPPSVEKTDAGEWLFHKIKNGSFDKIQLQADLMIGDNDLDAENVKVQFDAKNMDVHYSSTLMPITNANVTGEYFDDTLTLKSTRANIGDIVGKDIHVKMSGLSVVGGGLAEISLTASGPLKTALEYIAADPISVDEELGFDRDQVNGDVDFSLDLSFPTVKDLPKEEVTVVLDGTLNEVTIPNVVKGLTLSGGPYQLGYKGGEISLSGSGQLSDKAIKVGWRQYFDPTGKEFESQIRASIAVGQKMRDAFGIGLERYIQGDIPIDIIYTDYGSKALIDINGDLTPTILNLSDLGYQKKSGVAGDLSLQVELRNGELIEVGDLSLQSKGIALNGGVIKFKKLKDGTDDIDNGKFSSVTLGKTKVSVEFDSPDPSLLRTVIKGDVIDLNPFLNPSKKQATQGKSKKSQALKVSASVKNMLGVGGEAIHNPELYLEIDQEGEINRIEMDAKIGEGQFYLRFRPNEVTGKRGFILEALDAGFALKAFGLYDKMRGGSMKIIGQPEFTDKTGNLYGKAIIENFKLKGAPVLAKLLGAMSVKGMEDLLSNDGIGFTKLESNFEWKFRDDGNILVLKDGKTSGSSLGLTFDGVMDQEAETIDLSGTIVPLSGVNNFIGDIPLIGNILTGGEALIAATYNVGGQASDPTVSLNPLSALTPGFLRKILFEESADNKAEKIIQQRTENNEISGGDIPANDNDLAQPTKKEAVKK